MNIVSDILERLAAFPEHPALSEVVKGALHATTAGKLLDAVNAARNLLAERGFRPGDRCALIGPNGPAWCAACLAVLAEGGVLVPRYHRQAVSEVLPSLRDADPAVIWCGSAALRDEIGTLWYDAPPVLLLDEILSTAPDVSRVGGLTNVDPTAPVAIFYTSGSTGEPRGAVLTAENVDFILTRTSDLVRRWLAGIAPAELRVFHYLPLCFVGSWVNVLIALRMGYRLIFGTDLDRLAADIALTQPHYFQNVPIVLERFRTGITRHIVGAGRVPRLLFREAGAAWSRKASGMSRPLDPIRLGLARALLFAKVRRRFGQDLRALISGSATLAADVQSFFEMLGIPVVQTYGLSETAAICTIHPPGEGVPGTVGFALEGVAMRLGDDQEILVRGPNVFAGYWQRPEETAEAFSGGWFRTGDQGEVDSAGRWRITGRIKNIIVTSAGHNVSPEPIEDALRRHLPTAEHVVVLGDDRKHIIAVATGQVTSAQVEASVSAVNASLPHYKRIYSHHISPVRFTVENGMLTATHKLNRRAIEAFVSTSLEAANASGPA